MFNKKVMAFKVEKITESQKEQIQELKMTNVFGEAFEKGELVIDSDTDTILIDRGFSPEDNYGGWIFYVDGSTYSFNAEFELTSAGDGKFDYTWYIFNVSVVQGNEVDKELMMDLLSKAFAAYQASVSKKEEIGVVKAVWENE